MAALSRRKPVVSAWASSASSARRMVSAFQVRSSASRKTMRTTVRAAFATGAVLGTGSGQDARQVVTRYVTAWEHGDYSRMYGLPPQRDIERLRDPQTVTARG